MNDPRICEETLRIEAHYQSLCARSEGRVTISPETKLHVIYGALGEMPKEGTRCLRGTLCLSLLERRIAGPARRRNVSRRKRRHSLQPPRQQTQARCPRQPRPAQSSVTATLLLCLFKVIAQCLKRNPYTCVLYFFFLHSRDLCQHCPRSPLNASWVDHVE